MRKRPNLIIAAAALMAAFLLAGCLSTDNGGFFGTGEVLNADPGKALLGRGKVAANLQAVAGAAAFTFDGLVARDPVKYAKYGGYAEDIRRVSGSMTRIGRRCLTMATLDDPLAAEDCRAEMFASGFQLSLLAGHKLIDRIVGAGGNDLALFEPEIGAYAIKLESVTPETEPQEWTVTEGDFRRVRERMAIQDAAIQQGLKLP